MTLPKVIATDLDGTLLDNSHQLTPRTQQALHAIRAHGIHIIAVTARPPRVFDEWPHLAESLNTAICANGAIVYQPADRTILSSTTIPTFTIRAATLALRTALPGISFAVETGLEVIAEPQYTRIDNVGHKSRFAPDFEQVLATAGPVVKLLAHHPNRQADDMLTAARTANLPDMEISHSGGTGLLELAAAGTSKATTLQTWCAGHNITADQVIAFGDMPNDIPMLTWAGRSYAMANAHPQALAATSLRTASNNDHGVAQVLEKLIREHHGLTSQR